MTQLHLTINPLQLPIVEGPGGWHRIFAIKGGVDQFVNNSTNFVNISRLQIPFRPINQTWVAIWHIVYSSSAIANIKFRVITPDAVIAGYYTSLHINTAGIMESTVFNNNNGAIQCIGTGAGNNAFVEIEAGLFNTTDTLGDAYLQFAQNTAEISDTFVNAGSWVTAYRGNVDIT